MVSKFIITVGIIGASAIAYVAVKNKDKLRSFFVDGNNPINLGCWDNCICHGGVSGNCSANNDLIEELDETEEDDLDEANSNKFIYDDIDE